MTAELGQDRPDPTLIFVVANNIYLPSMNEKLSLMHRLSKCSHAANVVENNFFIRKMKMAI